MTQLTNICVKLGVTIKIARAGDEEKMAITVTWSVKIKDALGVTVSFNDLMVNVPDTVTLAGLQTITDGWTNLVNRLSDGQITLITCKLDMVITGARGTPVAGSEVERTGMFNFDQTTIGAPWPVDIPSLAETLIIGGKIDLTASAITDFITFMLAAHGGGAVVSDSLYTITGLRDSLLAFRKHRRAESRRSLAIGAG